MFDGEDGVKEESVFVRSLLVVRLAEDSQRRWLRGSGQNLKD